MVKKSIEKRGDSWSSHTFNEVYVGNHWHRLNYQKLGQNILDGFLGVVTHVHSYQDHAKANLAPWGLRYATGNYNDVCGGSNPYSAITLSDTFGVHCKIANPKEVEYFSEEKPGHLIISKLYWANSKEQPTWFKVSRIENNPSGHFLAHVKGSTKRYPKIYQRTDKRFLLKAKGHRDIKAQAERGFYTSKTSTEFYFRIPVGEYKKMVPKTIYSLYALNASSKFTWKILPGVTLQKN